MVGSKVYVAEVAIQAGSVVWRVASGPGWSSVGCQPVHLHGALAFDRWEDDTAGRVAELSRSFDRVCDGLAGMATELEHVQVLPLG